VLHAQQPDSTTFRRGQWGTEFALGSSYQSLGVLRFATPARAWIGYLGVSVNDTRGDDQTNSEGFPVGTSSSSLRRGEVRVGHRWYRPLADHVAQHLTIGALASSTRQASGPNALPNLEQSESGAGVFADVGALWFVTPRLSLGAAWTTEATFTREKARGGFLPEDATRSTSLTRLRFGQVRVQGALYF
jgi:hypothetical protein